MPDFSQETIAATFLDVVEQLTFMFGELEDKDELEFTDAEFTQASMEFTGDVAGTLSVTVPTAVTAEIAANILGLDPGDLCDQAMLDDALKEMLNVVCGHVIMAIAGRDANFTLHAPAIAPVDPEQLQALIADDAYFGFDLDESPVLLGLVRKG